MRRQLNDENNAVINMQNRAGAIGRHICAMIVAVLLTSTTAHAENKVRVSTLTGEQTSGQLISIDARRVIVNTDGKEANVPLSTVTDLKFADPQKFPSADTVISLSDGSKLSATDVTTAGKDLNAASKLYGKIRLPLQAVTTIQFGNEPKFLKQWDELCSRTHKRDLLVIRKKDGSGLDFTNGVIGGVSPDKISFVLSGESIPVGRKRIFGLIYARAPLEFDSVLARVAIGPDLLLAKAIRANPKTTTVSLISGANIKVATTALASVDLSSDKIRYLSDMEPRDYKFEPFFLRDGTEEILYHYRRDMNRDGRPLRLGDKVYARGLFIHSKSTLTYRVDKKFRRFQAVMGIDQDVARRGRGTTDVTISADGRVLLETKVTWETPPQELNLDIAGARELKILVDDGGDTNLSDWLDLADARVIK